MTQRGLYEGERFCGRREVRGKQQFEAAKEEGNHRTYKTEGLARKGGGGVFKEHTQCIRFLTVTSNKKQCSLKEGGAITCL